MNKKHLLKVVAYSFGLFCFLWLLGNVALSITESNVLHGLEDIHDQEMEVETKISKIKLEIEDKETILNDLKAYLEELRAEREELVEQRNDIINAELSWQIPTVTPSSDEEGFSLDCLAYAIAVAETENCTTGMGVSKNNCFGIMIWPNGVRTGKWYANKEASYEDFKDIWSNKYSGQFPSWQEAITWTGNSNPSVWYNNVSSSYDKCINE